MLASGGLRRTHPFTPFVVAFAVALLALLLPGPVGPLALYVVVALALLLSGHRRAVRRGILVCLVPWLFLALLHGVMGDAAGPRVALAQAGRLGAVVTATIALVESFDPSRFLDAVAARGWSFHAGYLFVATLQAVPRLGARARTIVEAQRARGLRRDGSPLRRARAVVPLALPLLLGAVSELDERAMALETRGVERVGRRTPLAVPRFGPVDYAALAVAVGSIAGALAFVLLR